MSGEADTATPRVVKRYMVPFEGFEYQSDYGFLVHLDDYTAIKTELAAAKGELKDVLSDTTYYIRKEAVEKAETELAALRADVKPLVELVIYHAHLGALSVSEMGQLSECLDRHPSLAPTGKES